MISKTLVQESLRIPYVMLWLTQFCAKECKLSTTCVWWLVGSTRHVKILSNIPSCLARVNLIGMRPHENSLIKWLLKWKDDLCYLLTVYHVENHYLLHTNAPRIWREPRNQKAKKPFSKSGNKRRFQVSLFSASFVMLSISAIDIGAVMYNKMCFYSSSQSLSVRKLLCKHILCVFQRYTVRKKAKKTYTLCGKRIVA